MSKLKKEALTPNQVAFMIFGNMVGVGILSLPNSLVKIANQDAWLTTIIGGIYPVYIALITIYISRKYPKHNILFLSKKYFGKFLGSIMNFIFMLEFIFYATSTSTGFANINRVYTTPFLSQLKLIVLIVALCFYTICKGIKVIGKINEIVFYLTIVLVILPIFSLSKGSLLNISPVFGSGFRNILNGSIETSFSYAGIEILLLIYPYINDTKKIKSASLKGAFLTVLIYTWIVFMTTYYFALNVTSKNLWPFLSASEIIDIPLINNFRFFFMLLWSLILLKTITLDFYIVITILKDFMKNISIKKICFSIYPFMVAVSFLYSNEMVRRYISGKIGPLTIVFPIIYVSLIALLIRFKG